ncbi:zinc-binding dehydrogenase [Nocardioides carbamazepini]|uniref:zinc-binding dehydrogenase n=1 Tax=Nocardioides carbamazepini TaxID=2854259 RepID=UPI00214A86D0|nr:zinc-binding dehydrogenase [Nocardioides carbamazepini]MCR1781819.1 zinc-binding dehydrogenase [Nocardioides carbamazepini]
MRAIRHHAFGPADVLRLEQLPDPEPGAGQLRVAVEAAGVHLLDTSIRAGMSFPSTPLPELPMVPGREVAGVVDRVGAGVDDAWVGRRVVAHLGPGARGGYAELTLVDAGRVYDVPDGLDAPTAVAAIGTGRTAAGILDHAAITADDVVVVTSAAGGLGALLIQGARNAGARTVGLAGGAKLDLVRGFGADTAVDYRDPEWLDVLRAAEPRLTLLLDGVGGKVPRALHGLLEPGGRMVRFSGDTEGYDAPDRRIVDVLGPVMLSRLAEFEQQALAAAADGSRVPHVGTTVPLADAAAAHRALEDRTSVGKVVLLVDRTGG